MVDTPAPWALVCVTFNRETLLREFLLSAAALDPAPDMVIVVDNASTDGTPQVLADAKTWFPGTLVVHREPENTGGAGGFHRGMQIALDAGAHWVWLMDDDVEVTVDAIARLRPWTAKYQCFQGRKLDVHGKLWRWQPYITPFSAIPHMRSGPEFDADGSVSINSGTFEGMVVHRDVAARVGLPDPRFFITWDDITYGWLASRVAPTGYVHDVVMRRKPKQQRLAVGERRINFSSARHRYYIVRNRGHLAQYFKTHGVYRPALFAAGTAVIVAKEVARLVLTTRSVRGVGDLTRGLRDAHAIMADPTWHPAPAYNPK